MTLLMRDQENIDKGREQGLKEGEGRFAELTKKLLQDKRYMDLEKSTDDSEYRQKLYEEYHILWRSPRLYQNIFIWLYLTQI